MSVGDEYRSTRPLAQDPWPDGAGGCLLPVLDWTANYAGPPNDCPDAEAVNAPYRVALRRLADQWVSRWGVVPEPQGDLRGTDHQTFEWLAADALWEAIAAYKRRQQREDTRDVPSTGFYLYRLWAADGRLLYVGVSTNLAARLRNHQKRWGDLLHHATWEAQRSERAMLDAERVAIQNEDPAFNKAGIE